jgi:hypothetical protein
VLGHLPEKAFVLFWILASFARPDHDLFGAESVLEGVAADLFLPL